ncbi:MAG: hypothetical protein ACP5Q4_05290 [Candidatus Caldatribacteriaceae bacterium]
MNIFWKAFLYLGIYSMLHFGYEITQIPFLKPIFGTSESVFEHLKMGFFAYLFASLGEYLWIPRRSREPNFFFARVLSTLLVPWVIFVVWYLGPALWGEAPSLSLELSWALGVTFFSGMAGSTLEKEVERVRFSQGTQFLLCFLFGISAFLFVRFTYILPWIDVFTRP